MRLIISIVCALVVTAGLALPVYAFDTPKALVEAIYVPYRDRGAIAQIDTYFSDSLRRILDANLKREGIDAVGFDFDPYVNAQDFLLYDLQIGEPVTIGDRAMVNVSFFNFDHPTAITLSLIEEADGWKVDDIAALGVERHWLLSWLLTFDPFSEGSDISPVK